MFIFYCSISAMITISIIFVASVVEVLIKRKSNTTDVETEQNKGISVSKERIITKDDNPKNKNSNFTIHVVFVQVSKC